MVLVCLVLGFDAGQAVDAASAEPVAGAFEGENVGVVNDAVDHGGGDGLVAEDAAPAGKRQVAGEDQRGVLVSAGDELEEQVGGVLLEGQVADFVDDDQAVAAECTSLADSVTGAVRSCLDCALIKVSARSTIGGCTGRGLCGFWRGRCSDRLRSLPAG